MTLFLRPCSVFIANFEQAQHAEITILSLSMNIITFLNIFVQFFNFVFVVLQRRY